jgi:hypothetical protein
MIANRLPAERSDTEATGPAQAAAEGRDYRGRFAPGNAAGKGNPFARRLASRRQAILDAVSDEDVGRVARALLEQASRGDVAAAQVLLGYVVGRPTKATDPDTLDAVELRQLLELPHRVEIIGRTLDRLSAERGLGIARAFIASAEEKVIQPHDAERIAAYRRQARIELLGEDVRAASPEPAKDDSAPRSAADTISWEAMKQITGFSDRQLKIAAVSEGFPNPINLDSASSDNDLLFSRHDLLAWFDGKLQSARK